MLSLENITVQILYGLIAATISFLAMVNQVGVKRLIPRITSSPKLSAENPRRSRTLTGTERTRARSRPKSRGKTVVHSSRTRKARRRLRSKPWKDAILQPITVTSEMPTVAAFVHETVPACPTCGLQAPEALLKKITVQALERCDLAADYSDKRDANGGCFRSRDCSCLSDLRSSGSRSPSEEDYGPSLGKMRSCSRLQ